MTAATRAEVLRAFSGTSGPMMCVFALMAPFVVLSGGDTLGVLGELGPEAATVRMFQPLAWSFVPAAFAGAYAVTRETYYASLDRTLTEVGYPRAFWGKAAASAVVGMILAVGLPVAWSVLTAIVLAANGVVFAFSASVVRILVGAFGGAVLGALLGVAVGWIVRNYYVAALGVLFVPIAVELALLRTAPEVARLLPGLSLAALGVPHYRDALLSTPVALLVSSAWVAVLLVAGWMLGRRRLR
ncbi:hypothetical protein [Microbacterium sp. No. 7]|uniref:hypothetical protein n=1 Tax=Microbacterium sp. No. 7 TaxID=1714373 RepID=UPI0006D1616E|nr:hypothetical protein [Microbacterium sp. No. 7]ALJ20809.1 hypothetical protein AOA12_13215 [Microbacterium sp. No. 7]